MGCIRVYPMVLPIFRAMLKLGTWSFGAGSTTGSSWILIRVPPNVHREAMAIIWNYSSSNACSFVELMSDAGEEIQATNNVILWLEHMRLYSIIVICPLLFASFVCLLCPFCTLLLLPEFPSLGHYFFILSYFFPLFPSSFPFPFETVAKVGCFSEFTKSQGGPWHYSSLQMHSSWATP